MNADIRRIEADLANKRAIARGMLESANDADKRAQRLEREARSQKDRGRWVEGEALERQARDVARSAEHSRRSARSLDQEIRNLEHHLRHLRR
jgi:hypothetical protein